MSTDPFTPNENIQPGGASHVSVSITLATKAFGADAFIKLEETWAFPTPVHEGEAAIKRADMLDIVRDQAIIEAKKLVEEVKAAFPSAASRPAAPVAAAPPAPATGAAATLAVANGAAAPAPAAGELEWRSLPDRFDNTKQFRFVTTNSQPTEVLVAMVNQWLLKQGLNPDAFKVWDNRTGPQGLEAGTPQSCVAAVKVSKDAADFVSPDLAKQQLARVKHNADGSLYIWLTKEAEAALKYGALDQLKVQG